MSTIEYTDLTELVQLHIDSGLFICMLCNDGHAMNQSAIMAHVLKVHNQQHLESLQNKMGNLPNYLINTNIQISRLRPTKGLRCDKCNYISKQKNQAAFKQWHTSKSPICKDSTISTIDVQIRNGEVHEFVCNPAPHNNSFFQKIRQKYHEKGFVAIAEDDHYSSNPLQVYFQIFTIFGRDINHKALNDYKIKWDDKALNTVSAGFRNYFSEMGLKLSTCDVIRSIMGSGSQMFLFKRSSGSFDSIAKLWVKILNISANSTNNLFNVPASVRDKALIYYESRSVANLKSFLWEVKQYI